MRRWISCTVAAAVVAAAAVWASAMENTSAIGLQRYVSTIAIQGAGRAKTSWSGDEDSLYVGSRDGEFQGVSLGGWIDNLSGGPGPEPAMRYIGLLVPFTGINKSETTVNFRSKGEEWTSLYTDPLSNALDTLHFGPGSEETVQAKEPGPFLTGRVRIDSVKSKGTLSVDRKTFTKYRGKVRISYRGVLEDGPDAGATVKGTLVVTLRGDSSAPR